MTEKPARSLYLPVYCILGADEYNRHLAHVPVVTHLAVIAVHGIEAHLIFNTEHKYHHIYPVGELQHQIKSILIISLTMRVLTGKTRGVTVKSQILPGEN